MQYKVNIFIALIVVVILCSCGGGNKITPLPTEFAEKTLLREFDIENTSVLLGTDLIDSLLILSFYRNDSIFCVYNINTGELVTKFGAKGRQGNEFLLPEILLDYKHSSDNLLITDLDNICIKRVQLSDIIDSGTTQNKISSVYNIPDKFSDAYGLSASSDLKTMVGTSYLGKDTDAAAHLFLCNNDDVTKIASPFSKMFNYPDVVCSRSADQCYYTVNYDKKLIAAGYSYYDAIQFYDFEGNAQKYINLSKPKQVLFELKDGANMLSGDNMVYFMSVTGSDEHIFASRVNLPLNNFNYNNTSNKSVETDILKIDWNGEIAAVYRFDNVISQLNVDRKGKTLVLLSQHPTDNEKFKIQIYAI